MRRRLWWICSLRWRSHWCGWGFHCRGLKRRWHPSKASTYFIKSSGRASHRMTETIPLRTENDIVQARHLVREHARKLAFSLVDQTKLVTATSELARNTVRYGGGGVMRL